MENRILKSLTGLLLAIGLASATIGWTDSWESIRQATEGIETVQADFVQEKHLQILTTPLRSEGFMAFRQPDALRWEYKAPVPSILVMTGGSIARYVKPRDQWIRDTSPSLQAMQVVMQDITRWLHGRFDANPDFNARLEDDGRIVLTPVQEALSRVIQRIELDLAPQPGAIREVRVIEGDNNYTRLIFKGVTLNAPLDQSVFEHRP
jgi:outer membrane lipoprotein-sorting protein